MREISRVGAQGDVLFLKKTDLPEKVTSIDPQCGRYVVAHSETGHHHYVEAVPGMRHLVGSDPTIAYLVLDFEAEVIHARPHDTHETLRLAPGIWEVRRQREYVPQGWRRVED